MKCKMEDKVVTGNGDKEFTKEDLKPFMMVEFANGCKGIATPDSVMVVADNDNIKVEEFIALTDFTNNLIFSSHPSYTINAVYEADCYYGSSLHSIIEMHDWKKLWEREDVDWSKVPVDTKVLVRNRNGKWYKRYFYKYNYGMILVFIGGATSYTSDSMNVSQWDETKLYKGNEHLVEDES